MALMHHLGINAPFRYNCNRNNGGIILFVREDVPAKLIASNRKSLCGRKAKKASMIDKLFL